MASASPAAAGSVSKVECVVSVGAKDEGTISLYRHLAPLTVNAVLRALPLASRASVQPPMVCLFSQLQVGVEKPRSQFARGDVAFLPSGGLICIFLGDARSDRPLNPLGKTESGLERLDSVRSGDVLKLSVAAKKDEAT